ncbi:Mob1/phocein [Syncephalastrum racemosum]|uniref:Mob1/phocein n=1 Tax=Syncephalastrum racemosum TaxID=13706 RepID=A0A1X2HFW4_SYNRA|nr:Mob1/phocein [Syncephalastrum racemosum]
MASMVSRRLHPGSRVENAFAWPSQPLDELESSFHVQEYLQQLIREDNKNVRRLVDLPKGVDREVWQYEHLRLVCLELSLLVVALEPECTKDNCPEMKAQGWMYLCAAHSSTQSCPAIDYIIHTLDGATMLLNNAKYFPSRISIPEPSLVQFQSIARRLYRIFAHAYFHHPEIYQPFENETALYERFLLLSRTYNLVPPSLETIPDQHGEGYRAETLDDDDDDDEEEEEEEDDDDEEDEEEDEDGDEGHVDGAEEDNEEDDDAGSDNTSVATARRIRS